ncbi:hypothetical protein [Afipia sp. GAS231]|uniref:hypothetical protein n=1 Tax=Afipia sp. GAS231 TaxID=1882747 RepID=UPI00087C25FC|nr:hypothetical protein [Afipia sp. GAS231]SDO64892.1 hypothetical protein SAMN05444050_4655 [Afipia sp. GAS231]
MRVTKFFFAVGVSLLIVQQAQAQSIVPEPIKLPSSQFPTPSSVLDAAVAAGDTNTLRQHAWTLWSGLTADSTQSFQGKVLPIWETWLSEQEAFAPPVQIASAGQRPRILLPLTRPRQFEHGAARTVRPMAAGPNPSPAVTLLAGVKMNPDAVSFLRQPHETPAASGQTYSYTSKSDFIRLNDAFSQANTSVADRKIIDFPAAATNLKIVFLTVHATGLTPIPVWAGVNESSIPDGPTPDTWKNCVAVDPTNSRTGTASVTCNALQIQAPIVPINSFYWVQLDAAQADEINKLSNLTGAAALAAGDYQVLVAMHVTTKEIANWTWATFYWENGQDPPNASPGSLSDMPDANHVKGPYRNYAMCVSDAAVTPSTDRSGKPIVCFNPYLETAQADGIDSNCMSCHASARMPISSTAPNLYPLTYLPNGWFDLSDQSIFGGLTKTDFVWAIQNSVP